MCCITESEANIFYVRFSIPRGGIRANAIRPYGDPIFKFSNLQIFKLISPSTFHAIAFIICTAGTSVLLGVLNLFTKSPNK